MSYIEQDGKTFKAEVYYDKGGESYNGRSTKRGYYLTVRQVELQDNGSYIVEKYMLYGGIKTLLKEVTRSSKKALEEAMKIAELEQQRLIDYVANQQ